MENLRRVLTGILVFCISISTHATEKNDRFRILGPSSVVCVGQKIQLEASGPQNGYEYYWYPENKVESPFQKITNYTPTETTELFVVRRGHSNFNNPDTAYLTIKVKEKPLTVYGPEFVCLGSSASLEVAPNVSNPVWSTGENKHQVEVTKPGIYKVTANDGCILLKGSHYIGSKTDPLSRIMANRNTDLCIGDQIELRSFSAVNPFWSNGSTARSIIVKEAGTYELRNTNECGIDKTTIEIKTHTVRADFIPSATELQISENLELFNHSKNGIRYEWYQDGHLFSKEENAEVRFQAEGTYEVELHAFNEYGCKDEMTYPSIIVVSEEEATTANKRDVVFPNSFTPNGDGKNDEFRIYTGDINNLDVTIYNRWGQVIFESENTSDLVWNGTDAAGNKLEDGQYVITYKYINKYGEPISNTSTVNILR